MNRSAEVRSIDALQRMASALRVFADEASIALDDLRMDLHRVIQWIEYDQKDYWTQELRRAQQRVAEAKLNLERARMFRFGDSQPSCYEEKKALEAAQRRVEIARAKLEAVKRWGRLLEHESTECRSAVAPLAHWVQTDVPRAAALLRRLTGALESYVGMELSDRARPPGEGTAPASGEEAKTGDETATAEETRDTDAAPTVAATSARAEGDPTTDAKVDEAPPREIP
jgi:hypothetical protein